jgi:hypothetical protein
MHKEHYLFQHRTSMVDRLDDVRLDDRERTAAKAYMQGAETAADVIGDILTGFMLLGRKLTRATARALGEPVPRVGERPEVRRRSPAPRLHYRKPMLDRI